MCAVSIRGQAHVSVYITLPLLYCHNKTTDTHNVYHLEYVLKNI